MLLLLPTVGVAGCAGGYALAPRDVSDLPAVAWFSPIVPGERRILGRWSAAVGPPVVRSAEARTVPPAGTLVIVTWNTAIGAGNVEQMVADVRRAEPEAHLVLLLQEVFRSGPEVPASLAEGLRFPGRLGGGEPTRREIEETAVSTGLYLYYVPSMRNGGPAVSNEDRGNAILSTLPMRDLCAVELPFERQRRVAVAATVDGVARDGEEWQLRVMSAHLDNMVGFRRGWFAGGGFARTRQSRALRDHLEDEPFVVLGGDFNTWFGFSERAYTELVREFPDTRLTDPRPTFRSLLRLDHVFLRLPEGWEAAVRRADSSYGSDHHPLIATVRIQ